MYYKRCSGCLLIKSVPASPSWVQWTHHSEGKTHCEECLKLDGCWFLEGNAPPCPHHPFCHCTLEPIEYATVLQNTSAHSAYSKFDPYLFDPENFYKHGKNKMFERWGYTVADSHWLTEEIEKQALEAYQTGNYSLGRLNLRGQRINIRVTIPNRVSGKPVSFITGWMVRPNGEITLNTPYGGE